MTTPSALKCGAILEVYAMDGVSTPGHPATPIGLEARALRQQALALPDSVSDAALWANTKALLEREGWNVEGLLTVASHNLKAWKDAREARRTAAAQIHCDEAP